MTDGNGNRLHFGGTPPVWKEGSFPVTQGNTNQGFYPQNQVINNNNNTRAATPFAQNGAVSNANSNAQTHHGDYLGDQLRQVLQRFEQMMQQQKEEWTFMWKEQRGKRNFLRCKRSCCSFSGMTIEGSSMRQWSMATGIGSSRASSIGR